MYRLVSVNDFALFANSDESINAIVTERPETITSEAHGKLLLFLGWNSN